MKLRGGAKPILAIVTAALAGTLWVGAAAAQTSQPAGTQGSAAPPSMPQWQIDAGGKMEFDVASVKANPAPISQTSTHSNIPLGPQDMFTPTGGLLSAADFPLFQYMIFAYKLTPDQLQAVITQLPKWANNSRYDIEARASGNPTKDQFRLMMQALLADRFKLAVHYETKQFPVLALVLDKPGKLGPHMQPHPADQPCSTAPPPPNAVPGPPPVVQGGFPESCGALAGWNSTTAPGQIVVGGRNVPIAMIATTINQPLTGIDRPVLDKTGLTGAYDFVVEFTPMLNGPPPPGATFQPDPNGPTFVEAIKEQLGLKLEPQTGPVQVIVIDHVEEPSAN